MADEVPALSAVERLMSCRTMMPAVVCVQEIFTRVTSTVFEALPGRTAISVALAPGATVAEAAESLAESGLLTALPEGEGR